MTTGTTPTPTGTTETVTVSTPTSTTVTTILPPSETAPIAATLAKYAEDATFFVPAHKNELTVTVTDADGIHALVGYRRTTDAGNQWQFAAVATKKHDQPWTWGVQVDYRW